MLRKELIKFIDEIRQIDDKLDIHNDDVPFLVTIIIAFVIFAAGLYAFIDLTRELAHQELRIFDDRMFDFAFTMRSEGFTDFMTMITNFGDIQAYVVMTILISGLFYYIFRDWKYIGQVSVVLLLASLVNVALKEVINRQRPDAEQHLVEVFSLSYPSGHAMSAMAFYGFLIYLGWRLLDRYWLRSAITVFCVLIILAIGFSRIYLGVHYPSDVIGGFLGGIIWLALSVLVFNVISLFRVRKWREEKEIPDAQIEEHVLRHE